MWSLVCMRICILFLAAPTSNSLYTNIHVSVYCHSLYFDLPQLTHGNVHCLPLGCPFGLRNARIWYRQGIQSRLFEVTVFCRELVV